MFGRSGEEENGTTRSFGSTRVGGDDSSFAPRASQTSAFGQTTSFTFGAAHGPEEATEVSFGGQTVSLGVTSAQEEGEEHKKEVEDNQGWGNAPDRMGGFNPRGLERTVPFGAVHGVPDEFRNVHPLLPEVKRVSSPAPKQQYHPVLFPASSGQGRDLFLLAAQGDENIEDALAEASEEQLLEERSTGGLLHAAIAGAYPHALTATITAMPEAGFAVTDAMGGTALHAAAANACYPAVHELVPRMASALLATNDEGLNPLHLAIKAFVTRLDGGIGIWRTIYDATPPEGRMAVTADGKNVLHILAASQLGPLFPVSLVEDFPAEAFLSQDKDGLTPLHWAFAHADETTIDTILRHTPDDVYRMAYPIERDPLSWALCRSAERNLRNSPATTRVVEGTIASGALETTQYDCSPLFLALDGESSSDAFVLLAKAAPLRLLTERCDSYEHMPPLLTLFRGAQHDEKARLSMLQAIVPRLPEEELCARASSGETVLHMAANLGSLPIVEYLFSVVPHTLLSVLSLGETAVAAAFAANRVLDVPLRFVKEVTKYHTSEQSRLASILCGSMHCSMRLEYLERLPPAFLTSIPSFMWDDTDFGGPLHAIAQAPCQKNPACEECDKSIDILCSLYREELASMSTAGWQLLPHYAAECCAPRVLRKVLPILPDIVITVTYADLGRMTLLEVAARSGDEEVVKIVSAHVSPQMRTRPTSDGRTLVELFRANAGHPGSPEVCAALQPMVKSAVM